MRDVVLGRQKALERNGVDTTLQELVVKLANAYDELVLKNNANQERAEKLSDSTKQSLGARISLLNNVENDLIHHDEALKRLATQTTLLQGIGLGVRRSQPSNRLTLADDTPLASALPCRIAGLQRGRLIPIPLGFRFHGSLP